MGLENSSNQFTYVSTFNGMFVVKCKEGDQGAVKRKNKKGDEVWEKHYNRLTGKIVSVKVIKDEVIGKQYEVIVQDGPNEYNLKFSTKSRIASGIILSLPNINFSEDVTIHIRMDNQDNTYCYLTQKKNPFDEKGEVIPRYFTKDDPHGMPPIENLGTDDDPEWSSGKRDMFLKSYIENELQEIMAKSKRSMKQIALDNTESRKEELSSKDELDDLPF